MGHMQASEMAGMLDIDSALQWHFRSNHYPPLPLSLIPAAKKAIQFARQGQWERYIQLPEQITYKGKKYAPVSAAVKEWHLDAWIGDENE